MSVGKTFKHGLGFGPRREMGDFPVFDPTLARVLYNDFDRYVAADWTIDTAGPLSGVVHTPAADGGTISLTSDISDFADGVSLFFKGNAATTRTFKVTRGKKMAFGAGFRYSTGVAVFEMGLADTAISPSEQPANGFRLRRSPFANQVISSVYVDSVLTANRTVTQINLPSKNLNFSVAMEYDGLDTVTTYIEDTPISVARATSLPTTGLSPYFLVPSAITELTTILLDYFYVMKER